MGSNINGNLPSIWVAAYPKGTTQGESKKAEQEQTIAKQEGTKGVEVKRHDKIAVARVVLTSKEAIKPALQALGYKILATITTGQISKKFEVKLVHAGSNLVKIWARHYFGEDAIGEARNIGRIEALANKEDFEEAGNLLEQGKALKEIGLFKEIVIDPDKNPEAMISDGICAGIRLDIAQRHLLKGENLSDIIKANEKGAPKEAAANQAVYQLMSSEEKPAVIMNGLFKSLKDISKSEGGDGMSKVDFQLVGQALVQIDPELRYLEERFESFASQYPRNPANPNDLAHLMRYIVDEENNKARGLEKDRNSTEGSWMGRKNDAPNERWIIKDPAALQKAVLTRLYENYEKAIQDKKTVEIEPLKMQLEKDVLALNWTIGLLQHKQGIEALLDKDDQAKAKEGTRTSDPIAEKLGELWNKLRKQAISIFGLKRPSPSPLYDNISDPAIRHVLKTLNSDRKDDYLYHTVAFMRGLELRSLKDVMGHHSMHQSDESYLHNLPKLGPGTYAVDFATGTGGHAITYVKVSDQEGYILDPNGFQIKCRDAENTIQQFQKLLALYEEPSKNKRSPNYQKGKPDHHLVFQQFQVRGSSEVGN